MPLIVRATTPPPTDPGGGGGVELPEVGFAVATFMDPSGTVWPLTSPELGWFTLSDGVSGLGAAPYELTTDAHPRGGARLRHVQAQPRLIVWPLHVYGSDHTEFLTRWRSLARAFTRTVREGPGILEIARPDGTRRRIEVVYQEGMEGRTDAEGGVLDDEAVLSLWCADPYWVDPTPLTEHRETGTLADYLVPYPSVSSGQVLGDTTLRNPGDVGVWPTWRITGPATGISVTNVATGESFQLDPGLTAHGDLVAGDEVVVSTDPPGVRGPDGEGPDGDNWTGALNWPSATLWGLPPGETPVRFQLDGAGPDSSVSVTFFARYETA